MDITQSSSLSHMLATSSKLIATELPEVPTASNARSLQGRPASADEEVLRLLLKPVGCEVEKWEDVLNCKADDDAAVGYGGLNGGRLAKGLETPWAEAGEFDSWAKLVSTTRSRLCRDCTSL